MARLDDPSGEIRDFAVRLLPQLQMRKLEEYDLEIWENVVRHVLSTLLLHLDSPEIKLRQNVLGLGKSTNSTIFLE